MEKLKMFKELDKINIIQEERDRILGLIEKYMTKRYDKNILDALRELKQIIKGEKE